MKNLLFAALFLTVLPSLFGQYNSLRMGDPRNSWWTQQGTIGESVLSVKPRGLYLEYGLYMTFSAEGTNFGSNDTLEIVLDFTLPEEALVIDSWLWLEDDIIKAILIDRWTASEIYEDIVDRRKDPSILTRNGPTQYQLRVFPMAGNQTRKVKINYLMPLEMTGEELKVTFPWHIYSTSGVPLYDFDFLFFESEGLGVPRIEYQSVKEFTILEDPQLGQYYFARLPHDPGLEVLLDSPLKDGFYFGTFPLDDANGYYQMAVLPENHFDWEQNQKLVVLVDNELSNSTFSKTEIFNVIRSQLSKKLTPQDSFVLFVSGLQIGQFSNNWMPATSENIQDAMDFGKAKLASYSNLLPLLQAGIGFINEAESGGEDASVLLITNSDQYSDYVTANALLDDILEIREGDYPIHVMDYQQQNGNYVYIGGVYYYGNDYFNINLTHLTHGTLYSLHDDSPGTFEEELGGLLNSLNGLIDHFEIDVRLTGGYTYGKYMIGEKNRNYLNTPVFQVGRYHGEPPFMIELNGALSDEFFNYQLQAGSSQIRGLDSFQVQIWGGNYLFDLESIYPQYNNVVSSVIENSLEYRVLSKYTAFLCLEDSTQFCASCLDETELVGTDELGALQDSILLLYPNPFRDALNIEFMTGNLDDSSDWNIGIFDIHGQLIDQPDFAPYNESGKASYKWVPGDRIPPGVYFVKVWGAKFSSMVRVVKLE
jgi:Ca-activated chloride channel family protein